MKTFLILLFVTSSLLFTQFIDWETSISYESDDDRSVGIDIAPNGNILVACYTDGPNYSQWVVDTLISAPNTKVITLNPDGNIIDSKDYRVLFNDEVVGIGCSDTGYTLFGNVKNYYTDDFYVDYIPSA